MFQMALPLSSRIHVWEANSLSADQRIPFFLWIQRFITTFTRARHWTPFWARCIQPTALQQIFNIYSNGILWKSFFTMALPAYSGPRPLIQFRNHFSQTVGLLGRVISPLQGRYLLTGQHTHTHRINAHTNIHAMNGIRTHDPRVRSREDSSYLRPRGYCDQLCQGCTSKTISLFQKSLIFTFIWRS
jgi:hypothetical protein